MKPSQLTQLLARTIPAREPVLVTGAPGVGKSDIVAAAAAAAGARLIIEHPSVADPTDYKGLPFALDGQAEFLPFGSLREIINTTEPVVYFLDDLGQAPPAVQAACMQLLLARRVNSHRVSDAVTFIAASNRRTDRAGVTGLLEPVKSRFTTIAALDPDADEWLPWALAHGVPLELVGFVRYKPALLHAPAPSADLVNTPSPRTVAAVGRLMRLGLPPELEYEVYSGAAGEPFAAELCGFLRVFRTLPDPELILRDPDRANVPTALATLCALSAALAHRANAANANAIARYIGRWPTEISMFAMMQASKACPAVLDTTPFQAWARNHADVLV